MGLATLLVLGACNHFLDNRLESFEAASRIKPRLEEPIILRDFEVPSNFPEMVPFARIDGDFHHGDEPRQASELATRATNLGFAPDLLLYSTGGAQFTGAVTNHIGFGAFLTTPVYRHAGYGWCCRLLPARLGIRRNEVEMVVALDEATREQCQIQEGDTLLSVDGHALTRNRDGISPSLIRLLNAKPGEAVRLVWIRPGTGRMEAAVKLLEPHPIPDVQQFRPKPRRPDEDY